jgi:iron complex outermembrane receptor protein
MPTRSRVPALGSAAIHLTADMKTEPPSPLSHLARRPGQAAGKVRPCLRAAGYALVIAAQAIGAAPGTAGSIQGRVVSEESGNYLNNVRVRVDRDDRETHTDSAGNYRLDDIPAGPARLTASFSGHEPATLWVEVATDRVARADFTLTLPRPPGAAASDIVKLGTFTVRERELTAQAVAMHERRNAPNIRNVVAVDVDTGEGNLGEILKYVPGIGIDQNPQTPQFASIRGMPASGTVVTMNGMEMASNSYTSGRETDLGVAASGNIERVEISKVPTPDMPANAVGGSINLVTKSGFGRRTPQLSYNLYGTLTSLDGLRGAGRVLSRSGGPDPETDLPRVNPSLNLSYLRPFGQTFSVAASFSQSLRYNDFDYRRPTWDKVSLRLTSNSMNALAFCEGKLLAATTLDWKVNEQHALSMNISHSRQDIYVRQNVVTSTFGANSTGGPTFVQGNPSGVGTATMDPLWYDQLKTLDVFSLTHRFQARGWKGDANASYSRVKSKFSDLEKGFFYRTAGTSLANLVLRNDRIDAVDARRTPIVTAVNRAGAFVDIHNADLYPLTSASSQASSLVNDGRRAALNAGRELDLPTPASIRAGLSFNRTRNRAEGGNRTWSFDPPGGAAGRLAGNYDLIPEKFSARSHFTDANGREVRVRWLSLAKLKSIHGAHPEWFTYNEAGGYVSAVNAAKTIEETVSATYLRGDLKLLGNRLWLVGGGRYELTTDEGWGPLNDVRNTYRRDSAGNILRDSAGRALRITTDALQSARLQYVRHGAHTRRDYGGLYPSLNANYWLTPGAVVRAAYARTIGRPNFTEIIPGLTATDPDAPAGNRTVTVVNTALRPWTSDNYDLSFETYETKGVVASVSLFRKNVRNFFASSRLPGTAENLAEYGLTNDYLDFDIVTKRNAGRAAVTGLELGYRQSFTFLPAWGQGLQAFVNLTAMALRGANQDDFTNFNPRTVQQGISYVQRRFSARLGWNQTKWRRRLPAASSATVRPNSYNSYAPQTKIDVALAWMLDRRVTLHLDVRNLSATPQRSGTWSPDTPDYARIDQLQFSGAMFTFGVRGDF